jgi:hypothetical protein
MKLIRSLIALAFATALAGSAAYGDDHGKKPEAKPEKAACGCVVKQDGKVCGVDSDCCCTGEKAKGKDKADKKAAGGDKKAEGKSCCTDEACVPAEKGGKSAAAGEKKDDKGKGKDCTGCTTCK